jgi:hypothetical protein
MTEPITPGQTREQLDADIARQRTERHQPDQPSRTNSISLFEIDEQAEAARRAVGQALLDHARQQMPNAFPKD